MLSRASKRLPTEGQLQDQLLHIRFDKNSKHQGCEIMRSQLIKNRNAAMKKQTGLCYYCRQPMWVDDIEAFCKRFSMSHKRALWHQCTAEHLRAQCDGGTDKRDNIVAACRFCNGHRHRTKTPLTPDRHLIKVRCRLALGRWHGFTVTTLHPLN